MKTAALFLTLTLTLTLAALAGEPTPPPIASESLFKAGETTLNIAGTYTVARAKVDDIFDRNHRGGTFGVSLGGQQWVNKFIGIGGDVTLPALDDVSDSIISGYNVSLLARYPIGPIAPYGILGGGRNVSRGHYTVHVGAGLEYRFTKNLGAFAEYRYILAKTVSNEGQGRVGITFAF